ncbi:Rhamnogalacturonate lyase [Linum grandiflorum]
MSTQAVELQIQNDHVVLDNGILKLTISKPQGIVTGITFNGIDNLLEVRNDEIDRGYWDLVWSKEGSIGTRGTQDRMSGTDFSVIVENEEQVEVSFARTWDPSLEGQLPSLNIDKRFIMLRNSSGFYSYGIFEHLPEWTPFHLPQVRIVFKLNKDKFHYMAVGDSRQRLMPLPDDREPERCKQLDFPEAVLLVNPVEPEFQGEVDDKYQYSCENKDLKVHGWICSDPAVGFWQITPSNEFRSGGLVKQNLTSHVGPINLAMFLSAHYAGDDMVLKLKPGEPWKKVLGPVFMYLNTVSDGDPLLLSSLWQDAKQQMKVEVESWPYDFPASNDFPKADQRGRITGRFLVQDRSVMPGNGGYVGLAAPGEVGSWQTDGKGYQFWSEADAEGNFSITNIRPGEYNLYAWIPGFIGDYKYDSPITISPGSDLEVGDVVYKPPRDGPTVWEIGFPDRSAAGFYVPEADPVYANKLFLGNDQRFRQYGLWHRYTELYPDGDLVYTVGESDWTKDWFFAHIPRKSEKGEYEATTWQIKFRLENKHNYKRQSSSSGDHGGDNYYYKLRIALATANVAELEVRINDPDMGKAALFTTGVIGHDNTIARHGIHGLYRLYSVDVPASLLVQLDTNTFYFTQTQTKSPSSAPFEGPFQGVMYDYIRLESPGF